VTVLRPSSARGHAPPGRAAGPLRVALIAGTLTQGGAEKQLVYMTRALQRSGVDVRVYALTRGEFYDAALRASGIAPVWVGRLGSPPLRIAAIAAALRDFRPHVVQATHFYVNLYVSAVASLYGAVAIGAVRNDTLFDVAANGRWGSWLLRAPRALLVNSHAARRNAEALGVDPLAIHVLPNAISLLDFDAGAPSGERPMERPMRAHPQPLTVAAAGRLVPAKRFDRFLEALALARREIPELGGVLIGDGPERDALRTAAEAHGLLPDGVRFLGRRDDIPALLRGATMYALTSDHEGFPNVVMEAMAAGLPVITTPAGDAGVVVEDEVTGYVVPASDVGGMAERMVRLARSPELRRRFGDAGRRRVEEEYSFERLGERLLGAYRTMAERQGRRQALDRLGAG
jgi:glycosyltransferase involved in cell wall biosynthesis